MSEDFGGYCQRIVWLYEHVQNLLTLYLEDVSRKL